MDKPAVKHITMTCPQPKCFSRAFVQVLVVPETELRLQTWWLSSKNIMDIEYVLGEES